MEFMVHVTVSFSLFKRRRRRRRKKKEKKKKRLLKGGQEKTFRFDLYRSVL